MALIVAGEKGSSIAPSSTVGELQGFQNTEGGSGDLFAQMDNDTWANDTAGRVNSG